MSKTILFDRIALVGIGLIGSSLARVIKRDGLAGHVVANARSRATLDKVTELGIADSVDPDTASAVTDADLVVICTPVGAYDAVAKAIRMHMSEFVENDQPSNGGACPECGGPVEHEGGCCVCHACGYSECA